MYNNNIEILSIMILGLIIGAIIRYGFTTSNTIQRLPVIPAAPYNQSIPPDILWFQVHENMSGSLVKNKTFAYSFRGEIIKQDSEIDKKV
jgi:sodium/hydrogen exchanger-like protein 6/7